MALTDNKILESERNAVFVKSVPGNMLPGTVEQNKNVFDKFPQLIMDKYNSMLDLLIALGIDTIQTDITNRYTKEQTDAEIEAAFADAVVSVEVDTANGKITVTKGDGTSTIIDTALEKIPASFDFVSENDKYYIKVTNIDGTTSQTEVTNLMNQFKFNETEFIKFSTSTIGTTTTVTATIKAGSIGFTQLDSAVKSYFDELATEVESNKNLTISSRDEAVNASQTATGNANLSFEHAEKSESWAVGKKSGVDVLGEDETYHNNAKYYSEQSALSAGTSAQHALNSESSASHASDSAVAAQNAQVAAEKARDEAEAITGGDKFATKEELQILENELSGDISNLNNTKANKTTDLNVTLLADAWVGSEAPFTQDVAVAGFNSQKNGQVFVADPPANTNETYLIASYAMLRKTSEGTNTITIQALGEKPTADIVLTVRMEV